MNTEQVNTVLTSVNEGKNRNYETWRLAWIKIFLISINSLIAISPKPSSHWEQTTQPMFASEKLKNRQSHAFFIILAAKTYEAVEAAAVREWGWCCLPVKLLF